MPEPVLGDLLVPGLRIVFCGTAAGPESARRRLYYAGRGNRFWPTLHRIGLTDRQLAPDEYALLTGFGIGLTDIVKHASGLDSALRRADFAPHDLACRVAAVEPGILAFNGKRAAQAFFARPRVDYGLQPERIGRTRIVVVPSTSGAASGHWDEGAWSSLAALVRLAGDGRRVGAA